MKKQYLGDSKDSFKWDYLNFLAKEIPCVRLTVIPMMTPKDTSKQGNTPADMFPASGEILRFCEHLQKTRDFETIRELPEKVKGDYEVHLHKPGCCFQKAVAAAARGEYFSGIDYVQKQILFLDPDTGFEPPKTVTEKHVKYCDIRKVLNKAEEDTVVVVFQHARRQSFPKDHEEIKRRLESEADFSASVPALFWNCSKGGVMFVAICKSEDMIPNVRGIHEAYCKLPRPVQVQAIG